MRFRNIERASEGLAQLHGDLLQLERRVNSVRESTHNGRMSMRSQTWRFAYAARLMRVSYCGLLCLICEDCRNDDYDQQDDDNRIVSSSHLDSPCLRIRRIAWPATDSGQRDHFQTGGKGSSRINVSRCETDIRASHNGSHSPCLRRHVDQNFSGFCRIAHFPRECDAGTMRAVLGFQAYVKAQTVN